MLRRWRIEACPRIWSKHDATRFNDNEVVFKWPLIMHLSRTVSGIHKKIVRRWSGAWARFARLENIEKGIEFELVLARRATGKINRPSNRRKSLPKHLFVAQHIRHEFVSNKILYIYCNEIIHRAWDSWNLRILERLVRVVKDTFEEKRRLLEFHSKKSHAWGTRRGRD